MVIAVNVAGDGVGGGLGRASVMAIAQVEGGAIVSWQEYPVGWDVSHDEVQVDSRTGQPSHGGHHARIVRFLREHAVETVVSGHAGPPMIHTLELMGVAFVPSSGNARAAALTAAR